MHRDAAVAAQGDGDRKRYEFAGLFIEVTGLLAGPAALMGLTLMRLRRTTRLFIEELSQNVVECVRLLKHREMTGLWNN